MASKAAFVQAIYQRALDAGLTDAAARVMAAQAAIESGYGERAPGHNYFAITKGDQWTGPTITRTDKDAYGKPISQEFRSYDSDDAGIADRIAFMDQRFPGFNKAATVEAALAALQNGVKGKYYEAPQEKYEATVKGITKNYLGDQPAAKSSDHPVPPVDVPFSPNTFLGGKQYGKPGGGVGVNADRLNPEFANRMAALIQAAEAATGEQVSIFEGYRDPARQAQLRANYTNQDVVWDGKTYHNEDGPTSYKAAPPGSSQHQLGMATDIRVGADPDKAPSGPAFDYMREHAAEYGLHWFGSSDPAHFEMPEADYKVALNGGVVPQFKLPTKPRGETAVASSVDIPLASTYSVKAGDSLTKVAKTYGTTVDALAKANGLADPNKLSIGQTLRIPGASTAEQHDSNVPDEAMYGVRAPGARLPTDMRDADFAGGDLSDDIQRFGGGFATDGNTYGRTLSTLSHPAGTYDPVGNGADRSTLLGMLNRTPARVSEGDTRAEQRTLGASPQGATLGAPPMPMPGRPAGLNPSSPPVTPAPLPGFRQPVVTTDDVGRGASAAELASLRGAAPAATSGPFDFGAALSGLSGMVPGGQIAKTLIETPAVQQLGSTLGGKVEAAGKTLGNTAERATEAAIDAAPGVQQKLTDEAIRKLLSTTSGRTFALNTAMGITPAIKPEQRAADRNASAPDGYAYGSTGKKLYKIGGIYNSRNGQVRFDGKSFVPTGTAVKSEISITPPTPTQSRSDQQERWRAAGLNEFGMLSSGG